MTAKFLAAIFEGGTIIQNMNLDENELSANNDIDLSKANSLQ